jgi:hypothetical protein
MFEAASRISSTPEAAPDKAPALHLYQPSAGDDHSHRHASPSLHRKRAGGARAFELKFLLSPEEASEVEYRLGPILQLDPHADPARENRYRITTLYCDTPRWQVFHQQGRFRLFKLRLRRYGESEQIYLERKAKRKDHVRKLRSSIAMELLGGFAEPAKILDDKALNGFGGWYHRQLRRNELRPACLVEYQRTAYFGASADGPVRLTFDRQVHGGLVDAWSFEMPARQEQILTSQVVCEFKYRGPMPALFKSAMEAMQLTPGRVSKYRLCVQALGAAGGSAAHA